MPMLTANCPARAGPRNSTAPVAPGCADFGVGYNCSSPVWAAFKWGSQHSTDWGEELDLDGDGGWGVYPRDILKSSWVTEYP